MKANEIKINFKPVNVYYAMIPTCLSEPVLLS